MYSENDAKAIQKRLIQKQLDSAFVRGLCVGVAATAVFVGCSIVFLVVPVLP